MDTSFDGFGPYYFSIPAQQGTILMILRNDKGMGIAVHIMFALVFA